MLNKLRQVRSHPRMQMSRAWSRVVAVAFTAGLVPMVGCKPQVGGKCSQNGTMSKLDGTSVLTCVNGAYIKLPCPRSQGAQQ